MSARLQHYFAEYDRYHTTRGNEFCHYLGIPLIILALLGMLRHVALGAGLNVGLLLLVAAFLFYLTLSPRLALAMLLVSAGLYALSLWLTLALAAGVFVVGWILQFVGHGVYEKRAPAFLGNLVHLMVGPLWILNRALRLEKAGRQ